MRRVWRAGRGQGETCSNESSGQDGDERGLKELRELAKQPSGEEYSGARSSSAKALRPEHACSGSSVDKAEGVRGE